MTFQNIQGISVYIATLLAVAGFIPYLVAIWKQETKPERVTWFIWLTLNIVAGAGMYQTHSLNSQMIIYTVGDIFVLSLALPFGKGGWTKLDKFCLAGAGIGIALWAATRNPSYAVSVSMLVVGIGCIPTFIKTWHFPKEEDATAWSIAGATSIFQALAIPAWTIADALPPFTYLTIQIIMCALIFLRPKRFSTAV